MEQPEQSYYPAAKCRLIIRFDEYASRTKTIDAKTPRLPPQLIRGQKGYRAPLEVKPDPEAPPGVKRYVLVPKSGAPPNLASPQKQDKSTDDLTHIVGGIIPKTANHNANGIRTADTLTLTLPFIDCPFDPRTIRSCAVEYYLGTLTEEEFARGVAGQTRGDALGSGVPNASSPLNVLPDRYIDEHGQERTNLRFQGFVDKWSADFPENGPPMVTLECRDNTTLLIDQLAPPNLRLNPKKPIDEAIAEYLANFPRFSGLSVEYRPGGMEIPALGPALAKTAFRPDIGPPPSGDQAVWDYLTDLVGALGHKLLLTGTILVIQKAITLTSSDFVGATRINDPYQPRRLANGQRMEVRHLIYGRNVLSQKIERSYTVNALQNVEIRCYSPKRKKVLVARFPKVGDSVFNTIVRPGDIADQKWTVIRWAKPVEDEKALRAIAQDAYESLNRTEMTIRVKTKSMSSFGGGNLDPDILDMQATDTVQILMNREEEEFNSPTYIENLMLAKERSIQYLTALGHDPKLAAAYAESYNNINFQTIFRVRTVSTVFDIDNGVDIDIQCVNYLEVRGEKVKLPEGEQPTPKQSAGATPSPKKGQPL